MGLRCVCQRQYHLFRGVDRRFSDKRSDGRLEPLQCRCRCKPCDVGRLYERGFQQGLDRREHEYGHGECKRFPAIGGCRAAVTATLSCGACTTFSCPPRILLVLPSNGGTSRLTELSSSGDASTIRAALRSTPIPASPSTRRATS